MLKWSDRTFQSVLTAHVEPIAFKIKQENTIKPTELITTQLEGKGTD